MYKSPFQPPDEKLIVRLDPTTLSRAACARNFLHGNLQGLVAKTPSIATEFGQAIHKAAALARTGEDRITCQMAGIDYFEESSCVKPEEDYHTVALLGEVLDEYLPTIPKDLFKVSTTAKDFGVELPFEHPFRAFPQVDFVIAGVIDSIGSYKDSLRFLDIKSTGLMPQKFSSNWNVSPQMMVYSWVLKQKGFSSHYISPIIDALYLRLTKGKRFQRIADSVILAEHVEEYMDWLWHYTEQINSWLEQVHFAVNRNSCKTVYGSCFYSKICDAPITMRVGIQDAFYKTREYNPAKFGEVE